MNMNDTNIYLYDTEDGSGSIYEKPREKLISKGVSALSNCELLSIVLNAGIKNKKLSVSMQALLELLYHSTSIPSVQELSLLSGLGEAKVCLLMAMLEFGRRRWGFVGTQITRPHDIYELVRPQVDRRQERFLTLSLNGAYEVIALRTVTIGLVNRTIVHPREVYADPLTDRASAVIVAHNHPSGQITPSPEDNEITERLQEAGRLLGIYFLDHLVFSETDYFSYRADGRLEA
ncbi:MAG: DNA repair protein RadC [Spirochaetaceae bacterium]|jgi:DNA repair protein RadC|nr:DNA repair protein RadC [Spirochaetaceae bacterium]